MTYLSSEQLAHEGWRPIGGAPRGVPVLLLSAEHPSLGAHRLQWNQKRKRWEGYTLTPMSKVRIWWDETAPQPTHYKP